MFDDEGALMLDGEAEHAWEEFEHELRDAFDRRDGVHFEILMMRMRVKVLDERHGEAP